jgi:hypothetical protein
MRTFRSYLCTYPLFRLSPFPTPTIEIPVTPQKTSSRKAPKLNSRPLPHNYAPILKEL